jgi:hypothetical protein
LEKAVHKFLKTGFDRINKALFNGRLTVPTLQIKPMAHNATGNYAPAERHRPAVIGIFANVLMDEDTTRRVLAHYIVHHWENTLATDWESEKPEKPLQSWFQRRPLLHMFRLRMAHCA